MHRARPPAELRYRALHREARRRLRIATAVGPRNGADAQPCTVDHILARRPANVWHRVRGARHRRLHRLSVVRHRDQRLPQPRVARVEAARRLKGGKCPAQAALLAARRPHPKHNLLEAVDIDGGRGIKLLDRLSWPRQLHVVPPQRQARLQVGLTVGDCQLQGLYHLPVPAVDRGERQPQREPELRVLRGEGEGGAVRVARGGVV
mmetsp:Transcript_25636/g.58341  ORF Transcript_25636/g.58341 Transcript_25636/m.58341 type:complete len:206 (+) Transcript_25636:98-715(+)